MAQRCRLLELPPEIRVRIYSLALEHEVRELEVGLHTKAFPNPPALMRVCKETRNEALPLFYNTCSLSGALDLSCKNNSQTTQPKVFAALSYFYSKSFGIKKPLPIHFRVTNIRAAKLRSVAAIPYLICDTSIRDFVINKPGADMQVTVEVEDAEADESDIKTSKAMFEALIARSSGWVKECEWSKLEIEAKVLTWIWDWDGDEKLVRDGKMDLLLDWKTTAQVNPPKFEELVKRQDLGM